MKHNKQRGSAIVIALFAIIGLIVAAGIGLVGMYVSAANYGNRAEVEVKKVWENNQNVLGQYTLKVQEIASVPAIYKDDLQSVMVNVMQARMGKDGSKALFQFFKEQNIPFDSSMYTKIQQVIEAGRNEFQVAQTRLVDVKAGYEERLGSIPQGFFLHLAGYPKIDLNAYKPVVADDTRKAFETGVQQAIKLR